MLKITTPSANRVEIELSGALDAAEMEAGLDALIEAGRDITHGRMLYRIRDFAMPTMGALAVEMHRLPTLFGLIGKFDRCAVLADAAWIRKVAEVEGALFPGLEIRSFTPDDGAAAERWLAVD